MENAIKTKERERTPIDVARKMKRADQRAPFESLSESIRNKPEGVPLTNAQALEVLRWMKASWNETAAEAGLR